MKKLLALAVVLCVASSAYAGYTDDFESNADNRHGYATADKDAAHQWFDFDFSPTGQMDMTVKVYLDDDEVEQDGDAVADWLRMGSHEQPHGAVRTVSPEVGVFSLEGPLDETLQYSMDIKIDTWNDRNLSVETFWWWFYCFW